MKKLLCAILLIMCVVGCLALYSCGDEKLAPPLSSSSSTNSSTSNSNPSNTSSSADNGSIEDEEESIFTFELNDDGESYTLIDVDYGESKEVVIPSEYKGKPVTAIGDAVFYLNDFFTSVECPPTLKTIGNSAFRSSSLKTIILNEGLETIGNDAFSSSKVVNVVIPNSVTTMGGNMFIHCDRLQSITIPFVGENANGTGSKTMKHFFGTAGDNVNIPASLETVIITNCERIENNAFARCNNIRNVILPENLKYIGSGAFYTCYDLEVITIPQSVEVIGESAFDGGTNVVIRCEAASKPSGWDEKWKAGSVHIDTTWDCKNNDLAENGRIYVVEDRIIYSIGSDGIAMVEFGQRRTLKTAVIKRTVEHNGNTYSVESIAVSAFVSCTELNSLYIPNSVTRCSLWITPKQSTLTIYCEAYSRPSGWERDWHKNSGKVVWGSYYE